jgi:hypothetical protein
MKNKSMCNTLIPGTLLGLAFILPCLSASPVFAAPDRQFSGRIAAVNQNEKTILVESFWKTRSMNLADDCRIVVADEPRVSPVELREGQRVDVLYEDAQGVLIVHRITQQPETLSGVVESIEPDKRLITVRRRLLDKEFQIADTCTVVSPDNKTGRLADVRPGFRVTVTYEIPKGSETVFQIQLTSRTFTGSLTAIDLNERTLKAKAFGGTRKFNLNDDCRIVLGAASDGELGDLRIGDKVAFSYEEINGVLVANRVGRENGADASEGAQGGKNTDDSSRHVTAR